MKRILLLMFFACSCLILLRGAMAADTTTGRIASSAYVDTRIAETQERTVNKEEFNTFSDALPQQFVTTSTPQEISGTKTYTSSPIVPTPPLP